MKQIFIINEHSIGAKFGIGSYTKQLIHCLKKNNEWNINVVELFSPTVTEFKIKKENKITYINYPIPTYYGDENQYSKTNTRYFRAVYYILFDFIEGDNTIFHFNFVHAYELALLLKTNPHISVLLTLHYTNWGFELLGDRKKLKVVLSNPASKVEMWIAKKFEEERKFMDECCNRVFAIAQHSKDMIESVYKIDKDKVVLIPNGIKDEHILYNKVQLRKKYNFKEHERLVIFAGRIEEVKGVFVLIKAFKQLIKLHPNSKLIIAGDGAFSKCLSTSEPLWQNIIFTGFVEKKRLYELFSICDIGVIPSIHEEFGLVCIEMMMSLLPVIVGETTGLDEIIDKECGIKVKIKSNSNKSIINLMNAMNKLMVNKSEARSLAKNARQRYLNNYELKLFEQNILAQYSQL